jgi:hypothetical protein
MLGGYGRSSNTNVYEHDASVAVERLWVGCMEDAATVEDGEVIKHR